VCSERDNCGGKHCSYHTECFFQKARRRMYNADLLIVNHHLFFADLGLRMSKQSLLPVYKKVILDEAHTIEDVATKHLGLEISNFKVKYLLDKLYNNNRRKGFLIHLKDTRSMRIVNQVRSRANEFFASVESIAGQKRIKRLFKPGLLKNSLHGLLEELYESLKESRSVVQTKEEEMDISSYMNRIRDLDTQLSLFVNQKLEGYVYWVEVSKKRRTRVVLNAAPVNVGLLLRQYLFEEIDSVIMTSATISTNNSFDYFKERLGIPRAEGLIASSPFDYQKQVKLYIPSQAPDPNDNEKYTEYVIQKVKRYIRQTRGKAFVLFTSYSLMNNVYDNIVMDLEEQGLTVFKQGGVLSRTQMLEEFRIDIDSVLFGTDSFWQGVDVTGSALSNVIITKLPFSVPDHPVVEARMEVIAQRGGDPFMEYSLPIAILKLKQGFGRLIRHKDDKGIVVILDNRILTKPYGRRFLNSLPKCQMIVE
ncbi:MAG: helicase, partial [Candidatus Omnitrophica bacterium]|nr:helicase [Candidatus Omnitrophota bacterium]